MTEQQVAQHTDGTITLWVEGQPYLLRDSREQQRGLYGGWAVAWRARAAGFHFAGEVAQARVWAALADSAEEMCRRVEERG